MKKIIIFSGYTIDVWNKKTTNKQYTAWTIKECRSESFSDLNNRKGEDSGEVNFFHSLFIQSRPFNNEI